MYVCTYVCACICIHVWICVSTHACIYYVHICMLVLSCRALSGLNLSCPVLFRLACRRVVVLWRPHRSGTIYVCTHRRPCPCRSRAEGAPRVYNEFELSMYVVMYVCIKLCKCITNARMHVCMFVYIIYVYTSV